MCNYERYYKYRIQNTGGMSGCTLQFTSTELFPLQKWDCCCWWAYSLVNGQTTWKTKLLHLSIDRMWNYSWQKSQMIDIKSCPSPTGRGFVWYGQNNNKKVSSTWKLKAPGGLLVFRVLVQVGSWAVFCCCGCWVSAGCQGLGGHPSLLTSKSAV